MFNRTTLATLAAFVAVTVIAAPPISRTIHVASSADGLLHLARFSDDDFSLNPWSKNCYLIRQDAAVAILKRFGWPYRHRISTYWDFETPSLIYLAVSARSRGGSSDDGPYSTESDHRLLDLINVFVDRGLPINEQWDGYMPIHLAMLNGDKEVVELLIENEADLHVTIDNPGRAHHGLDSFEFADFLLKEEPQDYERIYEILKSESAR